MFTSGITAHKQRDVGLAMLIDTNAGAGETVDMPVNVSGDILVAMIANWQYAAAGVTWPAGWIQLQYQTGGASFDDCSAGAAYKVSNGNEPSTFTVDWIGNLNAGAILAVHSVRNGAIPLSSSSSSNRWERFYGNKINFTNNAAVVGFHAAARARNSQGSSGAPSGYVVDKRQSIFSDRADVVGHQEYTNVNAVGAWSWPRLNFRNYVPRVSVAVLTA